ASWVVESEERSPFGLAVPVSRWSERSSAERAPGEQQILPCLRLVGQAAQQIGRVVRDDERDVAIAMDATPQARDARVPVEQRGGRAAPERDDDLRANQCDLAIEIRTTRFDLERLRRAVVGRTALEDVGDVDELAAMEPERGEHAVEKPSGL